MKKGKIVIVCLWAVLCLAASFSFSQPAIDFGGTNAYVTFGNNASLNVSQFTLECWFKKEGAGVTTTTGTGGITAIPLIAQGRGEADGSTLDCNYFFGITSSNVLGADFEEGSGGTSPGLNHPASGVTVISNDTWYHAAATYDGATWKLYLNGSLEVTLTVSQPVQSLSVQHASIASALTSTGAAAGFFNGVIDEVRIWNTARTQAQILSTINSKLTTPQAGMIARWGLDEGSGTSIGDISGNNVTGTITGANYTWLASGAPFNLNAAPSITIDTPLSNDSCQTTTVDLGVTVSDPEGDTVTVKFYARPKSPAPANFTIMGLPDTQYYTGVMNGGTNASFKSQTNWIVANKNTLNIAHTLQFGDCAERGDNSGNDIEWKRADTAMQIIENPVTTGIPQGMSYSMNVGNHDQSPMGNPAGTTTFFNQYFGTARFTGRYYWGGNYGTNGDNTYQLFTASGIDFIVISLEYDVAADANVLTWANNLLQTYSNRKAIIVAHWFVNADGSFGAQGTATYNALKANPNLILMLCGHVPGEARRSDIYNGYTVHSLLADYQSRANGGDGWLRIMTFKPATNTIDVQTYSPKLGTYETDANSQFTLSNVNLYNGGVPYTLISTQTVIGGGTVNYSYSGLMADSTYEWYATAQDDQSTTSSTVNQFSIFKPVVPEMKASGNMLTFDGVNDWVRLGEPGQLKMQYWTLETWFKRNGAGVIVSTGAGGTTDSEPLVTKGMAESDGNTMDLNYHLGIDQSSLQPFIDFEDNATGGNHVLLSSCAITNNRWYHLAATWDGTDMKIYLDGILRGTLNLPGFNCQYNSVQDNAIGSACTSTGANTGAFNGCIDEVRMWNTALSQATIRDYMCKKITTAHPNYYNLRGHWAFDASSGTTVNDLKSCNDGTLMNFVASPWTASGARIGDASTHLYTAPSTLTITSPDGSSLTANSIAGSPDGVQMYRTEGAPNVTTPPGGYAEVDVMRNYGVHMCGCNTYTYTAVYNYTGHPSIVDESNIDLGQRSDNSTTSWTGLNATLNTSANTLTMTGRTGTEYVLLGRTAAALPMEVLFFMAKSVDNSYVKLDWETATETNSKQFIIEKSVDAQNFEITASLPAAGNSNEPINYTTNDLDPYEGVSYYRLQRVDLNGSEHYSNIVAVSFNDDSGLDVYPNPASGLNLNISIGGKKDKEVLVVLKDVYGKEYYSKIIIPDNDSHIAVLSSSVYLAPGIYIVTASNQNDLYSKKLVIK